MNYLGINQNLTEAVNDRLDWQSKPRGAALRVRYRSYWFNFIGNCLHLNQLALCSHGHRTVFKLADMPSWMIVTLQDIALHKKAPDNGGLIGLKGVVRAHIPVAARILTHLRRLETLTHSHDSK